jgi:hypothetical protein
LGSDEKLRRLERRAAVERWPMSAPVRKRVLANLITTAGGDVRRKDEITLADLFSTRERTAAARALIAADRLNLENAIFEHATRPIEQIDDDYEIDLGTEEDTSLPPAP